MAPVVSEFERPRTWDFQIIFNSIKNVTRIFKAITISNLALNSRASQLISSGIIAVHRILPLPNANKSDLSVPVTLMPCRLWVLNCIEAGREPVLRVPEHSDRACLIAWLRNSLLAL